MANIKAIIENQNFFHLFQPIKNLRNDHLFGMEALFRTEKGDPEQIFRQARNENLLFDLDSLSIIKSIETYKSSHHSRKDCFLFVNIFPSTLMNERLCQLIKKIKHHAAELIGKIVFEINEAFEEHELWDGLRKSSIIGDLQKDGFLIAFDDIGEGSYSFKQLVDFVPDFIKVSRYITYDIDKSLNKQKVLKLLLHYFGNNSTIILEGIETASELIIARQLGVTLGQGYLLEKPQHIRNISHNINEDRCKK
jgi:EAL domain-containing protein (putative c-di-GMP-specific phosphodiesterase class I)